MSPNPRAGISPRTPPLIAILGEDPIVGRALEEVVKATGYGARFFAEPFTDEFTEWLANAQLLLLAPGLSAERRQAFLTSRISTPLAEEPSVLELVTILDETQPRKGHQVLWPCQAEHLKCEIDAALLRRPNVEAISETA